MRKMASNCGGGWYVSMGLKESGRGELTQETTAPILKVVLGFFVGGEVGR